MKTSVMEGAGGGATGSKEKRNLFILGGRERINDPKQ